MFSIEGAAWLWLLHCPHACSLGWRLEEHRWISAERPTSPRYPTKVGHHSTGSCGDGFLRIESPPLCLVDTHRQLPLSPSLCSVVVSSAPLNLGVHGHILHGHA